MGGFLMTYGESGRERKREEWAFVVLSLIRLLCRRCCVATRHRSILTFCASFAFVKTILSLIIRIEFSTPFCSIASRKLHKWECAFVMEPKRKR